MCPSCLDVCCGHYICKYVECEMVYICDLSSVCVGKETAVFVLHGRQREGVADGVPHSLHQSDRWPVWTRGASSGAEKWSCM